MTDVSGWKDLASEVANRPTQASSVEMGRFRARFDADRATQLLSDADAQSLTDALVQPEILASWDKARVLMGRAALRGLGLVDHSVASQNWYIARDLPHLIRRMKPWIIANGQRVHVFKIVRAQLVPPEVPCVTSSTSNSSSSNTQHSVEPTNSSGQFVPLTAHEARLASAAYDSLIVVDVAHFVYAHPRGYVYIPPKDANRFSLPTDWSQWPLESTELYLRQPFHKIGTLTMSWADRRATGTLRPEAFAYEDPTDQGGIYMTANSAVVMPSHETLMHNMLFAFPAGSYAAGNDGCETPNLNEPFELRQAKAIIGSRLRLGKSHRMEIRAIHASRRQRSTSTIVIRMSKYKRGDRLGGQHITLHMQFLSVALPVTVVWMALGFGWSESLAFMRQAAGPHWYERAFDPMLRKMKVRHPKEVRTPLDACLYIAEKADRKDWTRERKLAYAQSFLQTEFMPQIGLSLAYNRDKALFLAHVMVSLFMVACGYAFYQSKDAYYYQRYDGNGTMWSSLQRQVSYKVHTAADRALRTTLAAQQPIHFRNIFSEQKTSDQIASCVAKGSWSVNRFLTGSARTGATLALKTTTWLTYASSVRRSNTANKAHRRSISARQVDEAQYGRLCAVETPEGEQCGIARFQACGSTLSVASSGKALFGLLRHAIPSHMWRRASDPLPEASRIGTNSMDEDGILRPVLMDLDGALVWRLTPEGGNRVIATIRQLRRRGLISPHVGCNLDGPHSLQIRTCPGRNVRLILVLQNWLGWLRENRGDHCRGLSLTEALRRGVLEYVDALEERALSICFSFDDFLKRMCAGERFSHMEVDPSWMLGITAGSLPHSDHNQSPRSVLGSAMSKQTFSGVINPFRLQTTQHILEYPHRPICRTRIAEDFQVEQIATGQMVPFVVVATDHTMEDSWEMNEAALDRGLHRCTMLRRYVAANKPSSASGRVERFEKPDKTCVGLQDANYSRIGPDGLPAVGAWIEPEDVVIGRTYRDTRPGGALLENGAAGGNANAVMGGSGAKRDNSICVRDERGVVQSVGSVTTDSGQYHIKEVVLRTQCLNEIGDKYFCRHGQKGTTGINRKESDMYFSTVTGRPAVVHMSPIGILARMTHGHLKELHMSTAAAIVGRYVNATPFLSKAQKDKEIDVAAALMSVGAQRLGYERFINGMTGELTEPLLTGLIYMSPLVHLVGGKIHGRNRGPRKLQTRQPDDGRSKHGGLRFGQMEVDAFAALGAADSLIERLKTASDGYLMPVCSQCGLIAEVSRESGYRFCRTCFTGKHVALISVSYSNKLFFQELYALHIKPQLILADEISATHASTSCSPSVDATTTTTSTATSDNNENDDDNDDDGNNKDDEDVHDDQVDSYYRLLQVAEPEPWEWERLGIAPPVTLRKKLQDMSAAALATASTTSHTPRPTPRHNTPSSAIPTALLFSSETPSPAPLPPSAAATIKMSPMVLPIGGKRRRPPSNPGHEDRRAKHPRSG